MRPKQWRGITVAVGAKSDLGLRPVFHHKEDRVQAHILVCFLALAVAHSLVGVWAVFIFGVPTS